MPIVEIDGTDVQLEFPEGATPDQIKTGVQNYVKKYKPTVRATQQTTQPTQPTQPVSTPSSKPRGADPMPAYAPDTVARSMQYPKQPPRPSGPLSTVETAKGMWYMLPGLAAAGMQWAQKPLVDLQGTVSKYTDNPYVKGALEAGEQAISGFTSPMNIAMLVGMRKASPAAQRALSATFGVDMAANSVAQVQRAIDAIKQGDPRTATKEMVHAALGTGMAAGAFGHAKTGPKVEPPKFTDEAKQNILKDEAEYQKVQEGYRNPQPRPVEQIAPQDIEFATEWQIYPAKKQTVTTPNEPLPTKPVKKVVPQITEATPENLQTTAAKTAETIKPVLEQQLKSNEPIPANEYELFRNAKVPKLETPQPDVFATEWGYKPPTPELPTTREALAPGAEPTQPVAKSSILQPDSTQASTVPTKPEMAEITSAENQATLKSAELPGQKFKTQLEDASRSTEAPPPVHPKKTNDSSIYLGSGFGALQKLYDQVTNGVLSNKIASSLSRKNIVEKAKKAATKFSEQGDDYLLPLRELDEKAGLSMASAKDLEDSSYVRGRMNPGVAGAAEAHILDLHENVNVPHKKELRQLGKKAGMQRAERDALLPTRFKWQQLVALTEDVPAMMDRKVKEWLDAGGKGDQPEYIYPENKTLDQLKLERAELEKKLGPQMVDVFKRQAKEFREKRWEQLYNILVEPYWAKGEKGIMSPEQFERMKADNPNHISLRRLFEDNPELDNRYVQGGSMNVRGNTAIQQRKFGSAAKLSDPLAESNIDTLRSISLAMKNSVLATIAKLPERNPAMKGLIKRVYEDYDAGPNEHVMQFREAGRRAFFAVPKDVAPVIERLDRVKLDTLADFIAKSNRLYRDMVTATPQFQTGNVVRDFATAMTTSAHSDVIPVVNVKTPPIVSYLRGMGDALLRDTKYSKQLYRDYLKNFAGGSGMKEWLVKGEGGEQIQRLNQDITHPLGYLNPKKLWHGWQHLGMGTELGPRMMAFRNALEAKESPIIAGYRARNITADFYKHGANKTVNVLRYLTPFVGARWQGTKMILNILGEGAKSLPGVNKLEKYGMAPSRLNQAQKTNLGVALGGLTMLAAWAQIHNLLFYPEAYAQVDNDEKNSKIFWLSNVKDDLGRYRTKGTNLLSSEFNMLLEPIRGLITYAYHEHPQAFLDMARKFYPDLPESPVEIKPDLGKTVVNTLSSISPYSFAKDGTLSGREFLSSAVPPHAQALMTAITGTTLRTGAPVDQDRQALPQDRTDKFTKPSSVLASQVVNKVLDALSVDRDTAIRSPRVLQETLERSVGTLPGAVGDMVIRGANKLTGKQLVDDPSARLGNKPTENMFQAAGSRLTTVRTSNYDSDESKAVKELKMEHGSHNLRLRQVAETYTKLNRENKSDEATKFLTNFIQNAMDPKDEAGFTYLSNKIESLEKTEAANEAVREYNKTHKANMQEMTNTEISLLGESNAVKAQRFIEKLNSFNSQAGKERFLDEWTIKGLLNDGVYAEVNRILDTQDKQ